MKNDHAFPIVGPSDEWAPSELAPELRGTTSVIVVGGEGETSNARDYHDTFNDYMNGSFSASTQRIQCINAFFLFFPCFQTAIFLGFRTS